MRTFTEHAVTYLRRNAKPHRRFADGGAPVQAVLVTELIRTCPRRTGWQAAIAQLDAASIPVFWSYTGNGYAATLERMTVFPCHSVELAESEISLSNGEPLP